MADYRAVRAARDRGRARRARRRERSLQAAGGHAAAAARRRRDRRDGVRALHDDRAAAEDARTTGATTKRWPAATRSSRKASTGCTSPAASGPRIVDDPRLPAVGVARRAGPARQEHDGGVPLRQRRRRRALLLARDSVAVPGPAAVEAVRPRRASSRSSRTALFVLVRGDGPAAAACFPGFRDIRGYQAMYRDFVRRDPRTARSPR